PVWASSGTCTTTVVSVHCDTVAKCPPKSTPSSGFLVVPNPLPKSTTFVPTGPLVGSTRTDASTFTGIELLTTCLTGAQHDPSGTGSEEAMRMTTSPDCTLPGNSTSILSSRHLRTRTLTSPTITLFTPKIVFGSRGPAVLPKCSPVISRIEPGSTSAGETD